MADEGDGNVIDMAERSKKRRGKRKGSEESGIPTGAELYEYLAGCIDGTQEFSEPFPEKFYAASLKEGRRRILRQVDGRGEVEESTRDAVAEAIVNYGVRVGVLLKWNAALEATDYWMHRTTKTPMPPDFRWPNDEGLTFQILPWTPVWGSTPLWDELIGSIRPEDRRSLLAWVGSLFVPESYNQQYIWIFGGGGNGKGAIARFLHRLFGRSSQSITNVPEKPNQFWVAQFLNKRLGIFPDCENYQFPASGLFKSMSGGDPQTIEEKFQTPYTAILNAKYLFTSNQMPNLSSERADMRRAIFIRLEREAVFDPSFEDRLWQEGGAFISKCLGTYHELCPSHGPIAVDNQDLHDWVATLEEPFSDAFDEWFELDEASYLLPSEMQKIIKHLWSKRGHQLEFLKWMDRIYKIKKSRPRLIGDCRQWRYAGLKMRKIVPPPKKFEFIVLHEEKKMPCPGSAMDSPSRGPDDDRF